MKRLEVPADCFAVGYVEPLAVELSPGWVEQAAFTAVAVFRSEFEADCFAAFMSQVPHGHPSQFGDTDLLRWVSVQREGTARRLYRVRCKYRVGSADASVNLRRATALSWS